MAQNFIFDPPPLILAQEKNIFVHRGVFTLSNAKHGESIAIGLAANATSKGPQVKTTEPMVAIKVTNCSIQLG